MITRRGAATSDTFVSRFFIAATAQQERASWIYWCRNKARRPSCRLYGDTGNWRMNRRRRMTRPSR
ncbi:hypothetical protein D8L93_09205 [Sodalis-like symbiont of Bactericera trigonica]|nr:hypothetical protein D8L93_09205 [Sodalis-like symbiont of Bactericera trigonica]